MYKKLIFILLMPFLFIACGNDDSEPELFRLAIQTEPVAEIAMGIHSAEITVGAEEKEISIDLIGDFDSYNISAGFPEWLTVTRSSDYSNRFVIKVAGLEGNDIRVGKVNFTVLKGNQSQSGSITIIQKYNLQ